MLRVSAQTTKTDIDLQGVIGNEDAASQGILFGAELMRFAEAIALGDDDALYLARQSLREVAGETVLVDAAGVAANFQRMVRIADAVGIPVDDMQGELGQSVRQELSLHEFRSSENSRS
ncbi:MAG: hypothetical protein ACJAX5_001077 [Patiriisocius sp.]|jgi:hypothetical protein